ncbi:MAG: TetR/AcrR family transcriptional regulator [Ornithinimicrobium sp.]
MVSTTVLSRRELNKERTRESVRAAVLELAAHRPLAEITVEEIADHAGVSRRTFFNYYASIDAVLVEATRMPMAHVAEAFLARPSSEDPLSAIIASLDDGLPRDLLQWCAVLGVPEAQKSEIHRQVWHLHTEWLAGVLEQRMGSNADGLFISALAGTIMSIFDATTQSWLQRFEGRLDQESLEACGALLAATLGYARAGWRDFGTASAE